MRTSPGPLAAAACAALRPLRSQYDAPATAAKCALLRAIARRGLGARSYRALDAVHDDLLFLCAFPDSLEVQRLARKALSRIEPSLRALSPRQRALANDSGMAGSISAYTPTAEIAHWVTSRWPRAAEFDWSAIDDTSAIDAMIRPLLHPAEDDGFESGAFSTRAWMDAERDARRESALAWLMASASAAPPAAYAAFRAQYDLNAPQMRWTLARSPVAVTHNALDNVAIVPRTAMRRVHGDPVAGIAAPLSGVMLLDEPHAMAVIDVARATLAARCREVYAFSHANPAEVWWCPLGDGVAVAVLGVRPERRLSLESNYGYVLFSNGVPVGYGGVTPLWHQANTGLNIFAPFRGSEAAFLWQQTLRAFHTLFGVTRFVVDAVQFGEDNDEAIASGAYWFYWRMGFRPHDDALRARAEREAARLAGSRTRKSSAATLRALAHGTLQLVLPGGEAHPYFPEPWLARCAHGAAQLLERTHPHDHRAAAREIAQRLAVALGLPADDPFEGFTDAEREGFVRLAPLVELGGGVKARSARERSQFIAMMRAKGGVTEQPFVHAVMHQTFLANLYAWVHGESRKPAQPR